MDVVARGNAPAIFDLKSASLSLVALVLKTTDLPALTDEMARRYGATPELFNHDPVVIDLSQLGEDSSGIPDFEGLVSLLRGQRLHPVGVRGGNPAQMEAALAAGLAETPDAGPSNATARAERRDAAASSTVSSTMSAPGSTPGAQAGASAPSDAAAGPSARAASASSSAEPSAPAAPVTPADAAVMPGADTAPPEVLPHVTLPAVMASTVIVDRPLRSGQQVYARGGDLIVLAAVNFGAEVIADGNIHVYAPLRGKAIAGAKGNVNARIFTTCMEPELVAIAGTYRTTENPLPAEVVGKPAQIRLDGERLVFEALE
jgi:septum site-determining protein MinC